MSNMSYCRFHNTLGDLRDCVDALEQMSELKEDADAYKGKLRHMAALEEEGKKNTEEFEDLEEEAGELEEYLDDVLLSDDEAYSAEALVKLCREIAELFPEEDDLKSAILRKSLRVPA